LKETNKFKVKEPIEIIKEDRRIKEAIINDEDNNVIEDNSEEDFEIDDIVDIDDIEDIIVNYENHASKCRVDSDNTLKNFVTAFENEVNSLMDKGKKK
jgi:hypothetical protein